MKTYEEVADKEGLTEGTKERFVLYMKERWGNPEDEAIKCQVGYASEWAGRFKSGLEYACSDSDGRKILDIMKNQGYYNKP